MLNKFKSFFLATTLGMCALCASTNLEGTYQKKAAYEGYGKVSPKTGKVKTETVNGYTKQDGTYVNPYARS